MDKQESLILESLHTGIFIVDAETLKILDLNGAACEMVGYTKDEIIGMPCFDTVCVRERIDCPMITKGKTLDKSETTLRRKDGILIQILKTAKQIKIDDRDCIIESFYDITERKNMENALRLKEQKSREDSEFLKIVIDSLPHPFYVINPADYSIVLANTASGLDLAAGKQICHKVTHQSDSPCSSVEHPCPLEKVKESWKPFVTEHTHYDKEGNPIIVEVHGFPILDKDGSLLHMIEYNMDITERELAGVSLRLSEERYRTLLEVLPEGLIIGDDKETIMMANKAMGEILGVDSNDLIGRNLLDFVDPKYASIITSQTRRRMSGTSSSYDIRMIRADGEPRDIHISAIPRINDQNEIEGTIGVISDITDQKKMEKNLRATSYELQERMKEITVVSTATDLMKDIDTPLETVLKEILPVVCAGFQFPEITCGRIIIEGNEVSTSNYNNPVATLSVEISVSGKSVGLLEIGYLQMRPESDEGPFFGEEVSLINHVAIDLSQFIERKRIHQEILQQSAKLNAVTRSALDAIIMIDPDGRIQFWNPASERIFGHSEEEMLGQNLHKIILPSKYSDAHRKGFEKFQQTGTGAAIGKVLELSGLRKNGSEFPVELALTTIRLGEEWGSVGIIRDITERKQNEYERLLQQKELEIYTSLLRHDLNNDLSGIVGSLEIVKMVMSDDPAEAQEFLDSSLALTTRMSNLLSAVSRTQILHDEPLGNMIREVAKLSADAKIGMEIQVRVDDELEGVKIHGGRLLPMVFENLFRNAAQHAGEKPEIIVELSAIENQVRIEVSDNGPGVPDDIRDRLFERGTTTKEGGGLGLNLSKKIVEAVGGSIELMPKKKDSGAQFEIVLPLST